MKKKILSLMICLTLTAIVVMPSLVLAQTTGEDILNQTGAGYVKNEVTLYQGGEGELEAVIPRIINIIMSVLAIIAVVIVLIGGFMWMTAAGNEERVKKAKQVLVAGVIGLAIILAAYAIASFVIRSLGTAVGS